MVAEVRKEKVWRRTQEGTGRGTEGLRGFGTEGQFGFGIVRQLVGHVHHPAQYLFLCTKLGSPIQADRGKVIKKIVMPVIWN